MSVPKEQDLLTPSQAAELMQVTRRTIQEWIRRDLVISYRVGRTRRIVRSSLFRQEFPSKPKRGK